MFIIKLKNNLLSNPPPSLLQNYNPNSCFCESFEQKLVKVDITKFIIKEYYKFKYYMHFILEYIRFISIFLNLKIGIKVVFID